MSVSPRTCSTMRRWPCRPRSAIQCPPKRSPRPCNMGWAWKIPLTQRFGNGYVYSSQFCSADSAETELRERLGLLDSDTPARHLKMRIGRVTQHWNKNCLAVGLSQGFIEPLEATALLFIQQTATAFVECLEQGDLGASAHDKFNSRVT